MSTLKECEKLITEYIQLKNSSTWNPRLVSDEAKERIKAAIVYKRECYEPLHGGRDFKQLRVDLNTSTAREILHEASLNEQQSVAMQLMAQGDNAIFIGPGGTGKTRLIRTYYDIAKSQQKIVIKAAFTGAAAAAINGSTINSLYTDTKRIELAHVLIIDEAWMNSPHLIHWLERHCRVVRKSDAVFGGLLVFLFSDPLQLAPVYPEHQPTMSKKRKTRIVLGEDMTPPPNPVRSEALDSDGLPALLHTRPDLVPLDAWFPHSVAITTIVRQTKEHHKTILNKLRMGQYLDAGEDGYMSSLEGADETALLDDAVQAAVQNVKFFRHRQRIAMKESVCDALDLVIRSLRSTKANKKDDNADDDTDDDTDEKLRKINAAHARLAAKVQERWTRLDPDELKRNPAPVPPIVMFPFRADADAMCTKLIARLAASESKMFQRVLLPIGTSVHYKGPLVHVEPIWNKDGSGINKKAMDRVRLQWHDVNDYKGVEMAKLWFLQRAAGRVFGHTRLMPPPPAKKPKKAKGPGSVRSSASMSGLTALSSWHHGISVAVESVQDIPENIHEEILEEDDVFKLTSIPRPDELAFVAENTVPAATEEEEFTLLPECLKSAAAKSAMRHKATTVDVSLGMPVMLTHNFCAEEGLINGTQGIVVGFAIGIPHLSKLKSAIRSMFVREYRAMTEMSGEEMTVEMMQMHLADKLPTIRRMVAKKMREWATMQANPAFIGAMLRDAVPRTVQVLADELAPSAEPCPGNIIDAPDRQVIYGHAPPSSWPVSEVTAVVQLADKTRIVVPRISYKAQVDVPVPQPKSMWEAEMRGPKGTPQHMGWASREDKIAHVPEHGEGWMCMVTFVPLMLSAAITIHKGQGMSLDQATIQIQGSSQRGQAYVGVSRVTDLDKLSIIGKWDKTAFRPHERAKAFCECLERTPGQVVPTAALLADEQREWEVERAIRAARKLEHDTFGV